MLKISMISCALISVSCPALADDISSCNVIINNGLREYNISSDSAAYLNTVFNQYCFADGRSNSSAFNAGLAATVQSIPVSLTLGSSDASQAQTNFCKNYKSSTFATETTNTYNETIVRRAYDSYDACLQAAALGFYVTHDILTPAKAQLLLRAGVGKPIEVDGIDTTPNVSCSGPPDKSGNQIDYGIATKNVSDVGIGIFCTRKSRVEPTTGVTVYDEGSVAIALAGTKYNFYWPQTSLLPEDVASQVQSSILELRTALAKLKDVDFTPLQTEVRSNKYWDVLYRKEGDNGGVSCSVYCRDSRWLNAGPLGTCVGALLHRTAATSEPFSCDETPLGGNIGLSCYCMTFKQ